ncbi:type III secretion system export apparatus subunit SctT [Roseibium sp.]|uniref:type III secretion system export apparatus subunit SctT n=2 Tax=Roseibium sp. TaxID=1936156 RepID=UPI0032631EB4
MLGGPLSIFLVFEDLLLALLISLPRVYAFIAMAGIMNASAVPRLARNACILILSLPLVPVNMAYSEAIGENLSVFAFYFAKEYAIGFVFGYMIGWIFWAVTASGDFMDNQRGAAIASSIDPLQGHETSPLGSLFSQAFVTYFYAIGGMLVIVELLYKSFVLWPVTNLIPLVSDQFPVLIFEVLDLGMRTMFILAAPVIAMMFLSEFALALVSRFAPQIQVFVLAMPIKSAIAIFILIFYIKIMFPFASDQQSLFFELTDKLYSVLEQGTEILADPAPRETGTP